MVAVWLPNGCHHNEVVYITDSEKIIEYETHIEDMLHAIQDRLDELNGRDLNDFEQGRHLALTEVFEIIHTRHQMILEVIAG